MFVYLVDEADVAAGEPVYGLPVVANEEIGQVRLTEGPGQAHAAVGDVLELVDEDVLERVLPVPVLYDVGGTVYQIVEVEGFLPLQQRFVALSDIL